MTLHYAPTTPEEEELALALALSASLSSTGPSRPNGTSSPRQSFHAQGYPSSSNQHNNVPASRPGAAPTHSPLLNPAPRMFPPIPPAQPVLRPPPPPHIPPTSRPSLQHPPATSSPLLSQPSSHPQPQRHSSSSSIPPPGSRWSPVCSPPVSPKGAAAAPTGASSSSSIPAHSSAHSRPAPTAGGSSTSAAAPPSRRRWQLPPQAGQPAAPLPPISRSKSSTGPGGLLDTSCGGVSSGSSGGGGCSNGRGGSGGGGTASSSAAGAGGRSSSIGAAAAAAAAASPAGTAAAAAAAPPPQLYGDPDACAGCGRGFGVFGGSYITGMGRKWHQECFRCGFCAEPISSGPGSFSYNMHPGDPRPYHPDCYKHVHHPLCCVCGTYIPAAPDGRISYRENGFWRERYCGSHVEGQLARCCACSRLQKKGQEWAPLPDGRPLCLQCLSSVQLDTADAQPLYDQVLDFYRLEMKLPMPYKPPLLLVDGATLNQHASAEGRDDSEEGPIFHVRGLCVAQVYSHIPAMLRGLGGAVRSVATALSAPSPPTASPHVHCHVKVLLVLFGLPRLLTGSIMAHELMHAWLRMEGVLGLGARQEEGLCQLLAALWLDRQHELLAGNPEEQRLASFFSYQIRTDTSEVYGEGFREAMEAFQAHGLTAVIRNIKQYGRFTPP